jgi:hypothetical protein
MTLQETGVQLTIAGVPACGIDASAAGGRR